MTAFGSSLDARDEDDVAVVSPPSEGVELAKSELAAVERRSGRGAASATSLPLILYSVETNDLRRRAETISTSAIEQARRIAARYSIMNLESIPLPSSDPAIHGVPVTRNSDLRSDSRRIVRPAQDGREVDYGRTDLWNDDEVSDLERHGFYHDDLVGPIVRPLTPREQGLLRLSRRVASRQARKFFREDLKDRREIDPTLSFNQYQTERDTIWQLGRGRVISTTKKRSAEFRSDVLDDEKELEQVDLIDWGPLRVDDSGSLGIDPKRLFRRSHPDLELAPENAEESDEPQGESLFSGNIYRVDVDFRFTPHFSEMNGGDVREFFGKVKAGVSVDFLDPLLHRRYLSTEIETWHKPDGDSAVLMNFVIWGN